VLYDGVREVASRIDVDVMVLHLGSVQFPITGSVRYSMTAADGVELCELVRPRVALPVHYEGWSHFHQGRAPIEEELASTPASTRSMFRMLEMGVATVV
jgi:L-ascorbate metabolism protein UlaG (beta-lactamase superfamily)